MVETMRRLLGSNGPQYYVVFRRCAINNPAGTLDARIIIESRAENAIPSNCQMTGTEMDPPRALSQTDSPPFANMTQTKQAQYTTTLKRCRS